MKIKNKDVYYCDYCGKHGLSKFAMERHERMCSKNPSNKRLCFSCEYLAKDQFFVYGGTSDLGDLEMPVSVFFCNAQKIALYTPQNEIKGNMLELPEGNYPMPAECKDYQSRTLDTPGISYCFD